MSSDMQAFTNGYRIMERFLVVFIISVCMFSFYLTVINYDVSGLGQISDTAVRHRYSHNSHFHTFQHPGSHAPVIHPVITDPPIVEHHKKWFADLVVNSTSRKLRFNNHPVFKGYSISNHLICANKKVDILVYFHSAIDHHENRRILRETWASLTSFRDIRIQRVFLVGRPTTAKAQLTIMNEQVTYGDLIQGDFMDSRKNLTYKAVMAVAWISQFCAHARYVIKADDDVFANIFLVVETVIAGMYNKPQSISCHVRPNGTSPIIRNPASRWWVPDNIFRGHTHYPTFCPGYFVVFSGDLAPILYQSTFTNAYFDVDDVYLFGMSLQHTKDVNFVDIKTSLTLNPDRLSQQYKSSDDLSLVACSVFKTDDLQNLWLLSKKRLTPWAKRHISNVVSPDYKKQG